jgi:hypothetical protein
VIINIKKIFFLFLLPLSFFAQGIYNQGQITLSGAARIYISGGTNGDYRSQGTGIINPSATGIVSLEGDWTNNSSNTGFSSDNGTVVMTGANQTINGPTSTTFYNLTLQGSGTKTQNLATSVGGVTTTNGVLSVGNVVYNLNSNILTVRNPAGAGITYGTGYILSETNAAVNPSIVRWNMSTSTGAHIIPFGVAGIQIPFTFNKTTAGASNIDVATRSTLGGDNAPWAGVSNVGAVTSFYCPNNGMTGNACAANSVIDRWWDITPSAAVTANVTFSYRGSENTLTAPLNTGNIGAQYWDGSYWNLNNATIGSAAGITAGVGAITANGLTQFCPYVLSSVLVPLPIKLASFNAVCEGEDVTLHWTTTSEKNGSYFAVMNSADGAHFTQIATVSTNGSGGLTRYTHTIQNKRSYGSYYKLKMVDTDLTATDSQTEFISDDCKSSENDPAIYYNPEAGFVITIISNSNEPFTFSVFDAAGRLLRKTNFEAKKGFNSFNLNPDLATGIYLVSINYQSGQSISKKIPVLNY